MARYWLGIDIGGTFTDFALFDTQTGEVIGLKVPSTPHEFAEAVRVGLQRLADEHRVDLREIGTMNSTFLNGKRLDTGIPAEIRTGDELRCGVVVLRFEAA